MIWYQKENRQYLQSDLFCETGIVTHAFTCRKGGVSHGNILGMNLGFRVDDNTESVMENYRLLADDLKIPMESMVLSRQTHTDHIRPVTEDDAGKGVTKPSDIYDTDALITDRTGISLIVFSADCVPILLLDPKRRVIAAVHAGWRGTVKEIAKKTVMLMQTKYQCDPLDIRCAIGPSIGPCCFTFGSEATEIFPPSYCKEMEDGRFLVDIWRMNQDQLLSQGILAEHIDLSNLCTVCHADTFYSYRTHQEHTGRQAAVIMLRP